jgi:hypothetical protein
MYGIAVGIALATGTGMAMITSARASILTGFAFAFALASGCDSAPDPSSDPGSTDGPMCSLSEGEEMYERFIAPLMADPEAQSCNNCHDPSMRLNVWEKATPCRTMACMVEKELIDLDDPAQSRVLEFIAFGRPEEGFDIQVEREHDGFVAWIEYGASCFVDACGEMTDPCDEEPTTGSGSGAGAGGAGGGTGSGVGSGGSSGGGDGGIWGDCSQSAVQAQFDALVFPIIDGCKSCHAEPGDPMFDNAKRWYHPEDSALTLVDMIGHSGMFNTIQMENSEVITKPLHQGSAYSSIINATFYGVEHEGGQKMTPAGPNFQERFDSLVTFIQYFAGCHD